MWETTANQAFYKAKIEVSQVIHKSPKMGESYPHKKMIIVFGKCN